MAFNEDSRVKIPALIHLTRLGYVYTPQRLRNMDHLIDSQTNIITDVFIKQLKALNPDAHPEQLESELKNINDELGFDDLWSVHAILKGAWVSKLMHEYPHLRIFSYTVGTKLPSRATTSHQGCLIL